ncbi:hypothetical protein XELAEV_18028752mg [Xenopus laevis]|uniref:Uncharacterized protein n=1 Tax=Xenopus laevis TaxID=8355 RepID=A0A974HH27_XENLA|nr:hypothetical protein XELAEV_18028752mg [Xenopus laevis]
MSCTTRHSVNGVLLVGYSEHTVYPWDVNIITSSYARNSLVYYSCGRRALLISYLYAFMLLCSSCQSTRYC